MSDNSEREMAWNFENTEELVFPYGKFWGKLQEICTLIEAILLMKKLQNFSHNFKLYYGPVGLDVFNTEFNVENKIFGQWDLKKNKIRKIFCLFQRDGFLKFRQAARVDMKFVIYPFSIFILPFCNPSLKL